MHPLFQTRVTLFLAFSNSLLQRKSTTTSKIFKMSEAQDSRLMSTRY